MIDGGKLWDADLIHTIFSEDIAVKILQVPISKHGGEDFASWPLSHFGHYTVRSVFQLARSDRVAMDRSKPGLGSSSLVLDNSKIWKKLWATKVPGKMKITLWRFAQDCLPCGHQLQKRHVPVLTSCIYCHQHETVEHALMFCPFAKEVWQDVKSDHMIHLHLKGFTSPRVWTLDFMDRCSQIEATILMVTFWHIWDARNKYREEGILNPFSIVAKIKAYIELIIKHLYKPSLANRHEPSTSSPKWVPPPVSTIMVNVDAALFASTRQMGASVCDP
jgi:hypothetical protein